MDAVRRSFLLALLSLPGAAVFAAPVSSSVEPTVTPNSKALAILASLQKNHAALLGEAKVLGEFNAVARRFDLHETGPLGRDYSIKMAWAPERRRALFAGANHGRPHRLNDVWEFDLASLAWIMLYAPDNPRNYSGLGQDPSDVVFEGGILITRRGGPAVIGHSWWGLTYDAPNRRLLFMNDWATNRGAAIRLLGGDPAERYEGPSLWSFDPQRRRWEFIKTSKPYPRLPAGGMLEYVPDLGGAVWHSNHWQMLATWVFRTDTGQWENLRSNAKTRDFASQSPKSEQVGYYDPVRRIVVAQRGTDTFHFDVVKRHWSRVRSRPDGVEDWPDGHDAFAPLLYDPNSGRGLLVDFRTNRIWSYRPEGSQWAELKPEGEPMPEGSKRLAYFDPEHAVLVVIEGTKVWVYRC